jgi:hypothetical protein
MLYLTVVEEALQAALPILIGVLVVQEQVVQAFKADPVVLFVYQENLIEIVTIQGLHMEPYQDMLLVVVVLAVITVCLLPNGVEVPVVDIALPQVAVQYLLVLQAVAAVICVQTHHMLVDTED